MSHPILPDSLDINSVHAAYSAGLTPAQLCHALLTKAERYTDHNIWTYKLSPSELDIYLDKLKVRDPTQLPLYGIPFVIKDNIDLAAIPTSAACPAFAYTPQHHAFIVELLINAGAVPLGKTNMDQFATGLVGTRSPEPYGVCHNALNPDFISGGSSSGSAVAVALGLASFSLGTDTAGSGRVPAMLNNIFGLKPSRGVFSCSGVVPACRSLDCPSVFALSAADLSLVFSICAKPDTADSYSRSNPYSNSARVWGMAEKLPVVAVPTAANLQFYGNDQSATFFADAVQRWRKLGATILEVDISPLLDAALLLYSGPWVAERYVAIESFLHNRPDAIHPVVKSIIEGGKHKTAADSFRAQYQMQEYKKQADALLASCDFLLTPTSPTSYLIDEVLADPVTLNSHMGYYTNYLNLLDLCGIAVPAALFSNGTGFGITLIAPVLQDQKLLNYAHLWQTSYPEPVGKGITVRSHPAPVSRIEANVVVAVCGAHLSGMPLNWQLTERGATLIRADKTASCYRLFALAGGPVARPGLNRDSKAGVPIDIELWSMPNTEFGDFVANIPAPLGIGKLETAQGEWVCGFICEPWGLDGATEISEYGSWRSYMNR